MPFRLHGLELGGVRLATIVWFCAMTGFLHAAAAGCMVRRRPTTGRLGVRCQPSGLDCRAPGSRVLAAALGRGATRAGLLALPLCSCGGDCFPQESRRVAGWPLRLTTEDPIRGDVAGCHPDLCHQPRLREKVSRRDVRRDYAATVIATGSGFGRELLVNGTGMTWLTPVTKYMSHLPLAMMSRPPQKGLVICFGMGTSFRSMLSWGISTTSVDLIPSVPALFGYFHRDAASLLKSQQARIVVDDGRRFLDSSNESYDVIVVDPPPPPTAPASSLLYSREFYEIVKRHLAPGGILETWYPASQGDFATAASIAKALNDSFPHVRAFFSVDSFGIHFLASMEPLPMSSSATLGVRLPSAAAADFVEWGRRRTFKSNFKGFSSDKCQSLTLWLWPHARPRCAMTNRSTNIICCAVGFTFTGEFRCAGRSSGSSNGNVLLRIWCERGDSNPHGFTRQILSLVRLPIPPLSHGLDA